jgi:archaetidylinositol phosphate synthase
MQQVVFQNAVREQSSFLAPLERRFLVYLALHLPSRVRPDHLTALGAVGLLFAGVSYGLARWSELGLWLASGFIVLNWFGDSLDGTLARVRRQERPRYGFYVDHMLDSFGALFLLTGLAASGYMSERIAAGLLAAFFLLSIEVYLAAYTLGVFRLSFWKFSPTELRLLLIAGNIALAFHPEATIFGMRFKLFDVGGSVGIAGMSVMLLFAAVRHTLALYRAERLP